LHEQPSRDPRREWITLNTSPAMPFPLATASESQPILPPNPEKTTLKVPPRPRCGFGCSNELQNRYKFTTAICKQNEVAATAIQSLDCLNDQIVQYIVSSQATTGKDGDLAVPDESVHSSMVLIRKLLLDAQSRFRKMVEDNRQLASHIDNSIQTANQEVSMLRAELASTNKRLSQINMKEDVGKADKATQMDRGLPTAPKSTHEKSDKDWKELEVTLQTLSKANEQLMENYKRLLVDHDELKCSHETLKGINDDLKADNLRIEEELSSTRKENVELHRLKAEEATNDVRPSYGELKLELIQTRQELNRAKEVLQGMKSDRKRLKGEKLDLLSQMKQLYTTLEEKETELRDFIHNYEQRVKESDEMIKQIAKEKGDVEKEKWEIITRAKDAVERAMFFKTQLDAKEQTITELEAELKEAKEQLELKNTVTSMPSLATPSDSVVLNDNDEVFSPVDDIGFSTMEESSVLNCTFNQDLETNGQIPAISSTPTSNPDMTKTSGTLFKWFTHSSDFELPMENNLSKRKKKSFGSLSRVFSKTSVRRSVALPHAESLMSDESSPKLCVLSQDNYQEKLNIIEKIVGVHMKEWRAPQVLAWLEITLAMPMYAHNCLSNVKSGRILLGLSDSELSAALGVTNPMHRRKLRLAIEQHRNPDDIKYLKASEMDPTWIAHRLLPDLGLSQYTEIFEEQLCDGHVLNTLTRRDLEKHFSVHQKFHQSSILHAIELLRRIDFNKEKLYHRRNLSEEKDTDLIVWTNERLMKWTRSIDLGEYCENLVESGVHGALMVLEPSFNADTLASVLGIPPSKTYIRRHLATELDTILKPARVALDTTDSKEKGRDKSKSRKSSQDKGQQGFEDRGRRKSEEEGRSRLSFRGSLGRAFGKKVREDLKYSFDSSTCKTKISAPIAIKHSSLSSLNSDSELVKKGFCLKNSQRDLNSFGIAGDPALNGLLVQNIRQKCLAQSDQTLHRSLDLHSISEREDIHNGNSSSLDLCNGNSGENNATNINVYEDGKSSIASSQETLTEQSTNHENNNNRMDDFVTLRSKTIVCHSLPDNQQRAQENNIQVFTSDSHDRTTPVYAQTSRLVKVEGRQTSESKPTGNEAGCKFRNDNSKRGSMKDLLPQTTSV
jgi:hypothetical protein